MVNIILVILVVILAFMPVITGHYVIKAYDKGLTHNYELKHDMKPTESKAIEKETIPLNNIQLDNQIVDEWFNGPKEVKK